MQWRGFYPYGHFVIAWKKLKAYIVKHEPDAFEDDIIDSLNNEKYLKSIWEKHHPMRRIKYKISLIGYIYPKLKKLRSGTIDMIYPRIYLVD